MDLEIHGVMAVALIIGLCQLFKGVGVPKKLIPLGSLALGIAFGVIFADTGAIQSNIVVGIAVGLTATGLYSGGKNLAEQIKTGGDN